jgi:hypothetical protein
MEIDQPTISTSSVVDLRFCFAPVSGALVVRSVRKHPEACVPTALPPRKPMAQPGVPTTTPGSAAPPMANGMPVLRPVACPRAPGVPFASPREVVSCAAT